MAARAHFELLQYQESAEIYQKMRKLDPFRVEVMDLYGTCLWHLNRKMDLCSVGKELEEADPLAPQTWCVVGNYYSLLQEHDSAILAFKKAIQLDPSFAYAHTLMGHEYLSNEDLDSASRSFKAAIQHSSRHYNAM
jgi:anaphase-promoting complex subunit 3